MGQSESAILLANQNAFLMANQIIFLASIQKAAIYPAVFRGCHLIERLHQLIQITQIRDGLKTHQTIKNRIQNFLIMNPYKNHSKLLSSKKLMLNKLVSKNRLFKPT